MKIRWLLLPLCLCCLLGFADTQVEKLHFKKNGYSIAPLEGLAIGTVYQPLMMFLPGTENSIQNVGVQIQPYDGTMEEYDAMSMDQFKQLNFKMIKANKIDKNTITYEYTGTMQERSLHWYTKAIKKGAQVYLATASVTEDQWAAIATKMKACVDSFELDK